MITLGRLAPFPWSRMVTCALAATMFIAELRYTLDRDLFGPMYFGEQRYVTVGLYMRRILPANGVVFAIQHSGSLRFYTGRPTVRYDLVDDSWVSRAPAAATQAGYHPFAVFEDAGDAAAAIDAQSRAQRRTAVAPDRQAQPARRRHRL